MNVTELARKLKVSPQELRDKLPLMGFDIGQKAIKVDNQLAQKILKNWHRLNKQLETEKTKATEPEITDQEVVAEKKSITIPKVITVKDFAAKAGKPINDVLKLLMQNGIFVSMNERIDFDTAAIIGDDLDVEVVEQEGPQTDVSQDEKLSQLISAQKEQGQQPRPPIVVVMGHVDHGKTKLLDTIRKTNIIDEEAGGITQHIGAYQAKKNNRKITFIDTPGHEAFTAMRSRGAKVADIAILIIAADESIKPQTVEAFKIIEQSKLPFVVAINKIDKPEADIEKTKTDLSTQLNLTPEEWGGQTLMVPISAMTGQGIDDLLDTLLLVADINQDKISANPEQEAIGTIIESHIDKNEGIVGTILVQTGTLKINDDICINSLNYGKVRSMRDWKGNPIQSAPPSTPVKILGFKAAPKVGDFLEPVCQTGKMKKAKKTKANGQADLTTGASAQTEDEDEEKQIPKINLILKTDVLGSQEAIIESIAKLNHPQIEIKIIKKGLGNISENDVLQAESANAAIISFNVNTPSSVIDLAREKNVEILDYNIIYKLLEDIKDKMEELLVPEKTEEETGTLNVLAIFKKAKDYMIIGGKILSGKIQSQQKVKIIRNEKEIGTAQIINIQAAKEEVTEVVEGQECGLRIEGDLIVEEGDKLIAYTIKETKIKL